MSSQNAGTQSPKNEQANPMGSSDTKGNTSKGATGQEQRGSESSMEKKETGPSAAAISAAGDSASKIADPTSANHRS
ncbi:hypothetical protein QFC19_000068 [Naganishia cerealis]|uniref:Uncharacterized protein n=1 Tax=Naganishia cerealis TaxID=610337 RepID=A0ACC2WQ26_9TREE|nr:hypothetical protein QFC19_000068 [Naganishia cerealis]